MRYVPTLLHLKIRTYITHEDNASMRDPRTGLDGK